MEDPVTLSGPRSDGHSRRDGVASGNRVPRPPKRRARRIVAVALLCAGIGLAVGLGTTFSGTTTAHATGRGAGAAPGPAGGSEAALGSGAAGSNARSGPATGGASGTVASVSTPATFTLSTSGGQKVTIDETSSTTYKDGTSATAAGAVKAGESVLVLGTVNSTTITAKQVVVQPTGTSAAASTVIPFQCGAATTSKQVGQIPANWSPGSGSIVSGTAADQATNAALAAYSGGIVDRVVKLSTGEYNVHIIGVNWPHHVFVSQDFTVVGAE